MATEIMSKIAVGLRALLAEIARSGWTPPRPHPHDPYTDWAYTFPRIATDEGGEVWRAQPRYGSSGGWLLSLPPYKDDGGYEWQIDLRLPPWVCRVLDGEPHASAVDTGGVVIEEPA